MEAEEDYGEADDALHLLRELAMLLQSNIEEEGCPHGELWNDPCEECEFDSGAYNPARSLRQAARDAGIWIGTDGYYAETATSPTIDDLLGRVIPDEYYRPVRPRLGGTGRTARVSGRAGTQNGPAEPVAPTESADQDAIQRHGLAPQERGPDEETKGAERKTWS